MKVQNNNSIQNANPRKENGFRKLEMIKAERTHEKKLKEASAKKEQPKNIEDRVELTVKTTVRDKEKTVIGDVGANDPNDPTVHEKLKGLLRSGAFNFNDQERNVLGTILDEPVAETKKSDN